MKLATGVNVESLFYTINDEHVLVHDKFLGYLSISRVRAEPTRVKRLPHCDQRALQQNIRPAWKNYAMDKHFSLFVTFSVVKKKNFFCQSYVELLLYI